MSLAYTISAWNRKRKWNLFLNTMRPNPTTLILDVGFNDVEYSGTDNFLEKQYPHPENITALGLGEGKNFAARYPKVRTVTYDGKIFPFPDKKFAVCWSNAVLEHVGTRADQVLFLREATRVAEKLFITTPNRFFPIEVHTRQPLMHWLPKKWFDAWLRMIGKKWATGEYMNLLSKRELESVLKEAGIVDYEICENKLCGFVLDFVVIV